MGFPVPFCILPFRYNFIYILLLLLIFPIKLLINITELKKIIQDIPLEKEFPNAFQEIYVIDNTLPA